MNFASHQASTFQADIPELSDWAENWRRDTPAIKALYVVSGQTGDQLLFGESDLSISERWLLLLGRDALRQGTGQLASDQGFAALALPVDPLSGSSAALVLAVSEGDLDESLISNAENRVGKLSLILLAEKHRMAVCKQHLAEQAVSAIGALVDGASYQEAGLSLASRLASELQAEWVVIGRVRRRRCQLSHFSERADFSRKLQLVSSLEEVMDECRVARELCRVPADRSEQAFPAHQRLVRSGVAQQVVSLPVMIDTRIAYVAVCGFNQNVSCNEEDIHALIPLCVQVLDERRRAAMSWWQRLTYQRYRPGPVSVVSGLILAVLLLASVLQTEWELGVDARIQAEQLRVISPAYEGYLREVMVRPGDRVKQGEPLFTLDDRELQLERLRRVNEQAAIAKKHRDAVAQFKRAEAAVLKAELEQIGAQLVAVEERLNRTRVNSSMDAIVLEGDLTQRIGGSVEKGEVLLKLAPEDSLKITLQLPEAYLPYIRPEQSLSLLLQALPEQRFSATITRVTPVSQMEEKQVSFRVHARLNESSPLLRPGMEGVARVDLGERTWLWVLLHRQWQWLRTFWWKWAG